MSLHELNIDDIQGMQWSKNVPGQVLEHIPRTCPGDMFREHIPGQILSVKALLLLKICSSAMVLSIHDSALAEEYAVW